MNECVETVSSYIQFYENNIVPSKEVTCYPNNKPWLTKELKQKLIPKRQYLLLNVSSPSVRSFVRARGTSLVR